MPAKGKTFLGGSSGIRAQSNSRSYHSKGLWAIKAKNGGKFPVTKATTKQKSNKPKQIVKKTKNGARIVTSPRVPRTFANQPDGKRRDPRPNVSPKVRKSIVPGRVCIVLAGKYAGRRVVVLKALSSGLVVVTGPANLNTVPMRRVSPAYLIATSVRIDLAKAKAYSVLFENRKVINDSLFVKEKGRLKEAKEKIKAQKPEEKKEKPATKEGTEEKDSQEKRKLKVVLKHPRTSSRIEKRSKKKR